MARLRAIPRVNYSSLPDVDVPAWRLATPDRQHVVPLNIRRQRGRSTGTPSISGVLSTGRPRSWVHPHRSQLLRRNSKRRRERSHRGRPGRLTSAPPLCSRHHADPYTLFLANYRNSRRDRPRHLIPCAVSFRNECSRYHRHHVRKCRLVGSHWWFSRWHDPARRTRPPKSTSSPLLRIRRPTHAFVRGRRRNRSPMPDIRSPSSNSMPLQPGRTCQNRRRRPTWI